MSLHEQFVTEVTAFLDATKMTKTGFGKAALGDPNFVFELEAGRSPSAKVIDKVREYMAKPRQEAADAGEAA